MAPRSEIEFVMLLALPLLILSLAASSAVRAAAVGEDGPAKELPKFVLKDPLGKEHKLSDLTARGALIIVSIPNVKHAEHQDRWGRWLTKKGWPEHFPQLVFVQDLSQAKATEELSIEKLKEQYRPGKPPLILVDGPGTVRKAFGVPQDDTYLLVYDKAGKLVLAVTQPPNIDNVKKVHAKLKETFKPAAKK